MKNIAMTALAVVVVLSAGPAQSLEPAQFHQSLAQVIAAIKNPTIADPDWTVMTTPSHKTYTFSVATKGTITADVEQFSRLALETLNHPQGWRRAGIAFKQVKSGGNFVLYLSHASKMSSFSSKCSSSWSCRVGNKVVINQSRWLNASSSWNNSGGALRDYRHMVVNHEVGHWLGFGHPGCPKKGAKAPVMQQQSKSLGGCVANPWPLDSEIARIK